MLKTHDAALIIGDQGLQLEKLDKNITRYDLSEEWFNRTGKTFVHAVIAVSSGVDIDQNIIDIIEKSKNEGLARLDEISKEQGKKLGIETDICKDYLSNKIRYNLEMEEMSGLLHFQHLCSSHGLLPAA